MLVLRSERCNPMKETDIRKYAGLMQELGLTGLEITEENSKVRLERCVEPSAKETVYSVPEPSGAAQVSSEEEGVISEICVTNGQVVEYGTELFRIKR